MNAWRGRSRNWSIDNEGGSRSEEATSNGQGYESRKRVVDKDENKRGEGRGK